MLGVFGFVWATAEEVRKAEEDLDARGFAYDGSVDRIDLNEEIACTFEDDPNTQELVIVSYLEDDDKVSETRVNIWKK